MTVGICQCALQGGKAQVPAGIQVSQSRRIAQDAPCRTYHTLISPGKGKSRLEQVIEWVGGPDFDGAIVFDEAHKVCSSADAATGLLAQLQGYVVVQLSHCHQYACCHAHNRCNGGGRPRTLYRAPRVRAPKCRPPCWRCKSSCPKHALCTALPLASVSPSLHHSLLFDVSAF